MTPFEFDVKLAGSSRLELRKFAAGLIKMYPAVDSVVELDTQVIELSDLVVIDVRIVLGEETDYEQMCSLRSDLNSSQPV